MRNLSKCMFLALMTASMAVLPLAKASAQSNMQVEPAVVISIASIDEQMDDVKHLMKAAGMEAFGDLAAGMAGQYTEFFDTSAPMGGYLVFDDFDPHMVGFVAVEDLDAVLKMFRNELGDIDEGDNGVKIISMPRGEEIFIRESRGYAYISQLESDLDDLPSDPADLLGGLDEDYNIAIRIDAQNVPDSLKEMAIGFIEEGFDEALSALEAADPDAAAFQREMNQVTMQSMVELIQQMSEITIGVAVDAETESTYLDLTLTALPNTALADQIEAAGDVDSNFAGFLMDDAAATMHFASKMSDDDVESVDAMFAGIKEQVLQQIEDEAGLGSQEAELAQRVVGDLLDVMQATMGGGVIDGGATVVLDDNTVAMAAGMTVAEGNKIEDLAKDLVDMIEAEAPPEVEFNLNAETHNGVAMHVIEIDIPEFEEELRDIFGRQMTVVLGTSDDALYFAVGKNCLSLLKECMDDSRGAQTSGLPNSQFNVSMGKVMSFAASVSGDEVAYMLADALEGSENDHIRIMSTNVKNGARTRIEVEDDIIKLLGVAAMQFGGDFGPGF